MFTIGGFVLGKIPGRSTRIQKMNGLEKSNNELERKALEHQRSKEDLWERCRHAEESVKTLQLSIVQIPEIAQRLSGVRDLRQIPEHLLDLVQEIFEPSYSVFYRVSRGRLVAVAARGQSEFHVGHKLDAGEGIVGWTAVKQLPITPEDADLESAIAKQRNLERCMPGQGFSLSLPIVGGERTLGVILIGPSNRQLPHAREIGRTIALITAITITSTLVLKKEQMLAKTDGLTGLLNKTSIYNKLVELITSDSGPSQLSVFLLDIDHFKNYNDTNGHLPGDELLKRLGGLLNENSRQSEHVGRYGGEEFLLLMERATKQDAVRAADRIRALIEGTEFDYRQNQPGGRITISGGVATWPADGADVDALLQAADEALYEAKRAGRNQVAACADNSLASSEVEVLLSEEDEEKTD
jgi:diguanylate cyclase (GGDEF)-like protein